MSNAETFTTQQTFEDIGWVWGWTYVGTGHDGHELWNPCCAKANFRQSSM